MKQVCFFIIALLASAVSLHAQTETKGYIDRRSHSLPERDAARRDIPTRNEEL